MSRCGLPGQLHYADGITWYRWPSMAAAGAGALVFGGSAWAGCRARVRDSPYAVPTRGIAEYFAAQRK
ncbi:hypothetical protein ACWDYH_38080 [Nocardia goodfellowii]